MSYAIAARAVVEGRRGVGEEQGRAAWMLTTEIKMYTFLKKFTFVSFIFVIGCGGGSSSNGGSPTAPTSTTPPAPTVRTLALSKSSLELLIGGFEAVSATATYSDGSVRAASPTYSSANSGIATVDTGGNIRAVGAGVTSITATFSGATATIAVRGIPDFSGRFSGQYRFTSCSAPARWGVSYCTGLVGPLFPIVLSLSSSGAKVIGSIQFGSFTGTVDGSVADDGTLRLNGSYATFVGNLNYSFDLQNWQTRLSGNSMTGRWATLGHLSGESQTAFLEYEMVTVSR